MWRLHELHPSRKGRERCGSQSLTTSYGIRNLLHQWEPPSRDCLKMRVTDCGANPKPKASSVIPVKTGIQAFLTPLGPGSSPGRRCGRF
jgi:hypothetical protein